MMIREGLTLDYGRHINLNWFKVKVASLLGYKLPTIPSSLVKSSESYDELHKRFDSLTDQWVKLRSLPETHQRVAHLKKLEGWINIVRFKQLNIVIKQTKSKRYGSQ